jgi:pimeloyl-ACP methyl ester carboxylesterase
VTFLLIHGAWHDETCWDFLRPLLEAEGHRVWAPRLPVDDPRLQLVDYADVALQGFAREEATVVVGHSMSSDVAAIVAARTTCREVVYLCPRFAIFDRPEGEPEIWQPGCFDKVREDELGRRCWAPEDAAAVLYRRLEPDLAAAFAPRLRPQADPRRAVPPITQPPKVPSRVLFAEEDEIFRPEWSAWAARHLVGVEGEPLPGGHFPMLENPEFLSAKLSGMA